MSAEALKQEAHLQEAMSQRLAPGTQWPRIKKSLVIDFSRFLLLSYIRVTIFFPLKIVLSMDHCFGKLIIYIYSGLATRSPHMTADSGNPPRNACGCIQESQFNFPEKNGWILDSQIRLDGGYHQMTSGFHHRWWILDGGEWRIPKLDASNLIPPRPPVSAALPSPPP